VEVGSGLFVTPTALLLIRGRGHSTNPLLLPPAAGILLRSVAECVLLLFLGVSLLLILYHAEFVPITDWALRNNGYFVCPKEYLFTVLFTLEGVSKP